MKGIAVFTRPTLQPGTIPGPPTRAAPMFETIAPYKLGMTITSNCVGRATNCIDLYSVVSKHDQAHKRECIRVVNNHVVVLDSGALVLLSNTAESIQEEAIAELHDVGLVHARDFLYARAVESEEIVKPLRPSHTYDFTVLCAPCGRSSTQSQTQSG